ncbi:MAG: hypothetical protein Kow00109_24670 [Acidobacteriota bacterium]
MLQDGRLFSRRRRPTGARWLLVAAAVVVLAGGLASGTSLGPAGQADPAGSPLRKVLAKVQSMLAAGGTLRFGELYNSPDWTPEEKAVLGRLYETFFALPAYVQERTERGGEPPRLRELADHFGFPVPVIAMLLEVMEKDPRVPDLFERDPATGEIRQVHRENLAAFLKARGDVRFTGWIGKPLPAFELRTLDGSTLRDSDLRGRPGLLYFWFTGCPPCVRLAPVLAELYQVYGPRGFQFLGANADVLLGLEGTGEDRLRYVRDHGIAFPHLVLDRPTWKAFGSVQFYPTLFFFDADGVVVEHLVDFQERERLEAVIRSLLGEH